MTPSESCHDHDTNKGKKKENIMIFLLVNHDSIYLDQYSQLHTLTMVHYELVDLAITCSNINYHGMKREMTREDQTE